MIATAEYTISKIYDGQPGQPGSPGASVSSITRYYTISTSPTQLINPSWVDPDEPEWTTTQPSTDVIDETHYLWQKDITTLSNGDTIESNAWCERIISGIISQVNYDAGIISDKVWEEYTNTQIDAYDGSTTTTLGRKVSSMEQTVNGYDITVSGQTTHVDGLTERMTSAEGRLSVNENAITAMVALDDQSSSLTLTNNMIEAMTSQFVVKSPDGRRTIISGGLLSTDAIQSNNYQPPTGDKDSGMGTYPYSVDGSKFDLENGNIYTPNFMLDSVNGNAYLTGTIETGSGHIGGFTITKTSIYNNMKSFDDEIDLSNYSLDDNFYLEVPSYYMTEDGEIIDSFELDEDNYIVGVTPIFYGVYIGTDGIALGRGKFKVDSFGNLFANSATITGNITATSGSFGSTNGYYEIDDDGLVGYKLRTVYYFKMIEILANDEYDEGSVEVTSLSLETSSQSYSYSDILAIDIVTGVDLKKEDDKLFIILKTNSTTPISEIFDGTITSISCAYTYTQSGEELGGFGNVQDYTGLTTPSTETDDYISGTELGYDYLKTDKLIASDGLVIIDDNNQNAISISRSSVIVGNSLDGSGSSYIYIDNNDFTVFDSNHAKAFLISSDGALLTTEKRIRKTLEISTYSDSFNNPTTQTVTIDCATINLPTGSNYNAAITFSFYGKHKNANDNSWQFFKEGNSVKIEDIKNAGSSGLNMQIPYQNHSNFWGINFIYNSQSQIITVITSMSSTGQQYMKQIFVTLNYYFYTETTESLTPYCSIGSRKEDTTLGAYSITGGYDIEASGNYSQSFGCGTIAQGKYQTVIGSYNLPQGANNSIERTNFAFIIGNGSENDSRTNAFAIDWNGTAHLHSIRSIRHSYANPCSDGDAYEEILVGNMTYSALTIYPEPVDIAAWISATIIALCLDYPHKVQAIFKGRIVPNSAAYFEICIYDTSTTSQAYNYMPQYAYGVYRQWPSAYWIVWVDNYEFHYKAL